MKPISIATAAILTLAITPTALAADNAQARTGGPSGMQQGNRSDAMQKQSDPETIRQVQQQLIRKGHSVPTDGKMNQQTRAALMKFQQQQGLQGTGRLDPETLSALGIGPSQSGAIGSTGRSTHSSMIDDGPSGGRQAGWMSNAASPRAIGGSKLESLTPKHNYCAQDMPGARRARHITSHSE
jgi:hypothetical protein